MNRYFPQLSSGAVTQYPLTESRAFRTVVNETADGRRVRFADTAASRIEWRIRQQAISDTEWNAIEALFSACEGRLRTFTFLDPADNLLRHSEDLTQPLWNLGPALAISPGIADPLGTNRATAITNSSGAMQRVMQTLGAPGTYQYSLSVWLRAAAPIPVRLLVMADGSFAETVHTIDSTWRRCSLFASLNANADAVDAGIELPGNAAIEVFGFQVDAQPAPSVYKRTAAVGGVYAKARFLDDVLTQQTTAPGVHSAFCRITALVEDPA